jgi:hypothetical protein
VLAAGGAAADVGDLVRYVAWTGHFRRGGRRTPGLPGRVLTRVRPQGRAGEGTAVDACSVLAQPSERASGPPPPARAAKSIFILRVRCAEDPLLPPLPAEPLGRTGLPANGETGPGPAHREADG